MATQNGQNFDDNAIINIANQIIANPVNFQVPQMQVFSLNSLENLKRQLTNLLATSDNLGNILDNVTNSYQDQFDNGRIPPPEPLQRQVAQQGLQANVGGKKPRTKRRRNRRSQSRRM
jgi:hypothetical protein